MSQLFNLAAGSQAKGNVIEFTVTTTSQASVGKLRTMLDRLLKAGVIGGKRTSNGYVEPDQLAQFIQPAEIRQMRLSENEIRNYRKRLYSINANNAAGWRFKTWIDGDKLLNVLRIS